MGVEDRIKERIDDVVVKSYFKPWYKRTWGKIILFFVVIIVLALVGFLIRIGQNYVNIQEGKIYNEKTGRWITREQITENQHELSDLMTDDDPWLGSTEPFIYVVSYESFGCPFCQENQKDIEQMLDKYSGVVRFIKKDFPTEGLHENVFDAHLAAACANEQNKYWEYGKLLFSDTEDFDRITLKKYADKLNLDINAFNDCLDTERHAQEIRQDYASGVQIGVQGTPSYVINGNLIPGAIPIDIWDQIIAYIMQI